MITNPLKPKILSSVRNQIIITLLIRIYGFIITLPQTTGVSFYLVFTQHKWFKLWNNTWPTFFPILDLWWVWLSLSIWRLFYNVNAYQGLSPDTNVNIIGVIIPCTITVFCYVKIWLYSKKNSNFLRNNGTSSTIQTLSQREAHLTWTLFLVCFSIMFPVLPYIIYDTLLDLELIQDSNYYLSCVIYCIYWLHYSLSFFIYARNDQYWKAYEFFLQSLMCTK